MDKTNGESEGKREWKKLMGGTNFICTRGASVEIYRSQLCFLSKGSGMRHHNHVGFS
jgi:hypothetical protein